VKRTFSRFERAAGLFVFATLLTIGVAAGVIATKQGLFEAKTNFVFYLTEASDLREGASVELAGLAIGKITDIELAKDRRVQLTLAIRRRFADRLGQGSQVRIIRPFVLGEKIVEIVPSDSDLPLQKNMELTVMESIDALDLLRGKSLSENINRISNILNNIDGITKQANQQKHLQQTIANLANLTNGLKTVMPYYTSHASQVGNDMAQITKNIALLTDQMNALMPTVQEIAKTAPESSRLLTETLRETSLLMRAVQRTFLIRGRVEEIREEEKSIRVPASQEMPKMGDTPEFIH
jgi:phospholipid/cholesterol/gamma-HCH transport system substrate-binding protein